MVSLPNYLRNIKICSVTIVVETKAAFQIDSRMPYSHAYIMIRSFEAFSPFSACEIIGLEDCYHIPDAETKEILLRLFRDLGIKLTRKLERSSFRVYKSSWELLTLFGKYGFTVKAMTFVEKNEYVWTLALKYPNICQLLGGNYDNIQTLQSLIHTAETVNEYFDKMTDRSESKDLSSSCSDKTDSDTECQLVNEEENDDDIDGSSEKDS